MGASILALQEHNEQAMLRVAVTDAATGAPTPLRVKLTDHDGHATRRPEQAIGVMYGMWDHADGYGYQPDSSFYVDGSFELALAPGTYVLALSKGNEYLVVHDTLVISAAVDHTYEISSRCASTTNTDL